MQTARYKGKRYRLAWSGPTKYGHRTKLSFLDGSKSFWTDTAKVLVDGNVSDTATVRDPGEDAADRWNETHGDRPGPEF
jgi:hypothetical protein